MMARRQAAPARLAARPRQVGKDAAARALQYCGGDRGRDCMRVGTALGWRRVCGENQRERLQGRAVQVPSD